MEKMYSETPILGKTRRRLAMSSLVSFAYFWEGLWLTYFSRTSNIQRDSKQGIKSRKGIRTYKRISPEAFFRPYIVALGGGTGLSTY